MATRKQEVAARIAVSDTEGHVVHNEMPLVLHPTPREAKLQASHDALLQHLTTIIGQIVYGHHGVTRLQALMALSAMRDAAPLQEKRKPHPGQIVQVSVDWIVKTIERAGQ